MRWPWSKPQVKVVVYKEHDKDVWLWKITSGPLDVRALCPIHGFADESAAVRNARFLLEDMQADRVEIVTET